MGKAEPGDAIDKGINWLGRNVVVPGTLLIALAMCAGYLPELDEADTQPKTPNKNPPAGLVTPTQIPRLPQAACVFDARTGHVWKWNGQFSDDQGNSTEYTDLQGKRYAVPHPCSPFQSNPGQSSEGNPPISKKSVKPPREDQTLADDIASGVINALLPDSQICSFTVDPDGNHVCE